MMPNHRGPQLELPKLSWSSLNLSQHVQCPQPSSSAIGYRAPYPISQSTWLRASKAMGAAGGIFLSFLFLSQFKILRSLPWPTLSNSPSFTVCVPLTLWCCVSQDWLKCWPGVWDTRTIHLLYIALKQPFLLLCEWRGREDIFSKQEVTKRMEE